MSASPSGPVDPVRLAKLAEVAVKVGLRLEKGQDVVLTSPVEALPLARAIARSAYKAGAGLVTTLVGDEELELARYRHGGEASFDRAANWLYKGMAEAFEGNAARLGIVADNPMLLANEDPDKVGRANKARSQAYKPALEKIAAFDINWALVSYPSRAWAELVFPDKGSDEAVEALAEAIFAASRVNGDDPVAEWTAHNAELRKRTRWMNENRFAALAYSGPGTDLEIGLADGHEWQGGESAAKNGIICNPNIPTEEVFTTPHAGRVSGHVRSTKPLSHNGTLIDEIAVRFEGGKIVDATASKGRDVLLKVLDTDEGARRLGEVALVPHSSPISQSGILFYNTLFDENAASHIALGQCYAKCFEGGDTITPDQVKAQGGNSSLIHIDWMIGSDQIDIDGIKADGSRVPVMRAGEWASAV